MAPVLVTLNDLEGQSQVPCLFKCNPPNLCAAFYQISADSVLAWSLSDSWASCFSIYVCFLLCSLITGYGNVTKYYGCVIVFV